MKKSNKKSRIDDLMINVVEYAFTEWLVRQCVFVAFKKNYEAANTLCRDFRSHLRLHIQAALTFPELGLSRLVSSAFPFVSTPEGDDFWRKLSEDWKRFCIKFRS